MEKKLTYEVAFFNLLRNLIPTKFKYSEYDFSMEDMQEKLDMDKDIIRGLIRNLDSDKLIKILSENGNEIKVSFESSYDHLLEVFSIDDIESLIKNMQSFIKRNYSYFEFNNLDVDEKFRSYALKARRLMEEQGIHADLNPIIKDGINDILNDDRENLKLKKQIYKVCLNADNDEDLADLEAVLFCDVNFPKEENPFYVTLFLTKLMIFMKQI